MILYTCVHGFQSRHVASLSSECTPQGSTLMHMQVDRIKCMGFRIYTPPLDAKSQNFICHVPLSYVQGTIQDQGWQSLLLHLNLYKSFYIWTGCPFLPFSTPVQCIGRHQTRLEHFQLAGQVPNSSRLSSRLILIHFKKKKHLPRGPCRYAHLPSCQLSTFFHPRIGEHKIGLSRNFPSNPSSKAIASMFILRIGRM